MRSDAVIIGFLDELDKLASDQAYATGNMSYYPGYQPQMRDDQEERGSSVAQHLKEHWGKYLTGAAALAGGYALHKKWPAVRRYAARASSKTSRGASRLKSRLSRSVRRAKRDLLRLRNKTWKFAKPLLMVGIPASIAAYGLGRGLKTGERDLEELREIDAQRAAAAQGRYVPFREPSVS